MTAQAPNREVLAYPEHQPAHQVMGQEMHADFPFQFSGSLQLKYSTRRVVSMLSKLNSMAERRKFELA